MGYVIMTTPLLGGVVCHP